MARMLEPKCKPCRRLGESVCGTAKCALLRRNSAPGVHGGKRRSRLSGYAIQLREKQKAKAIYGLLERQFRKYYEQAKAQHGQTGDLMLVSIESRLDNVVYRAGFADTRRQSRQLVSHAQFLVNGRSVNIPSYEVSSGDVITVKEGKAKKAYWTQLQEKKSNDYIVPQWLRSDRSKLQITVAEMPKAETIQSDLKMNLIIELYSR